MQKNDELFDDSSSNAGKRVEINEQQDSKDQILTVYIWDMDETLILLKSLLTGAYAEAFNGSKDVQKGIEIGKNWEKHILQVCDQFFFYEQEMENVWIPSGLTAMLDHDSCKIEDYNKPFLDALREYDDGRDLSDYDFSKDGISPPHDDINKKKLAYRHRDIAHKYEQGLHRALDEEMKKLWDDLYELTDSYTDGWLTSARAFLEQLSVGNKVSTPNLDSPDGVIGSFDSKSQNLNILVTSGSLIPSLAKCILFRLDDLLLHQNVYSSWDVGKRQCFTWIKERFNNPNVRFCVIGDGWEECEAAQIMRWPFVQIDHRPGDSHKFPGLTLKTLGHYIDVVYENPDSENDEKVCLEKMGISSLDKIWMRRKGPTKIQTNEEQ